MQFVSHTDHLEGRRWELIESWGEGEGRWKRDKGGGRKSDLHVSYVKMMNMDDCSVHFTHFVENRENRNGNTGRE